MLKWKFFGGCLIFLLLSGLTYWSMHCPVCGNHRPQNVRLYVVFHKKAPMYSNDIVIPIEAGRAMRDKDKRLKKMIGDDTGDNISRKNDRYSELTAMYWIWKNVRDVDYVGIMHYRRMFSLPHDGDCHSNTPCVLGLERENVLKEMQKYDVIVPKKQAFNCGTNIYTHYGCNHYAEDFFVVLNTIRRKHPEMEPLIQQWLHRKSYYPYNMFIMKKELYDEYAAWLFDIFEDCDKDIDFNHLEYDSSTKRSPRTEEYQKRAPGFIAERLFDLWLSGKKDLKIKEYKVLRMDR